MNYGQFLSEDEKSRIVRSWTPGAVRLYLREISNEKMGLKFEGGELLPPHDYIKRYLDEKFEIQGRSNFLKLFTKLEDFGKSIIKIIDTFNLEDDPYIQMLVLIFGKFCNEMLGLDSTEFIIEDEFKNLISELRNKTRTLEDFLYLQNLFQKFSNDQKLSEKLFSLYSDIEENQESVFKNNEIWECSEECCLSDCRNYEIRLKIWIHRSKNGIFSNISEVYRKVF